MAGLFADRRLGRIIGMLLVTEFLWGAGLFFVLPTTTVPSYLRSLGASPLIVGVMAIAMGALTMPLQFYGRSVIERFPRRKPGLVYMHVAFIVPYFLIPLADHLLHAHAVALIAMVIILLSCSQACMGLIIPVWLDMLAQVIPQELRGRYFGTASGCTAIGGLLGAMALAGLQRGLGEGVFRGAFVTAGICYTLSIIMMWCTPIPESAFQHPPEPSVLSRIRTAWGACAWRTDFGRFILAYALQVFALAVLPFLVGFATDPHGLRYPAHIFSLLTILQALGAGAGAMVLGWLVDRHGPRWPWVAMTLFIPLILLLYPFGQLLPLLAVCTFLVGVVTVNWPVVAPALLELSPAGDKSGYVAMANLASFPSAVCAPLLLGGLIERKGYPLAFALVIGIGLFAFLLALTIRGRYHISAEAAEKVDVQ